MNPTITSAELNDGRPEITPAAGPREGDTKLQLLARILDAVKDGVGGGVQTLGPYAELPAVQNGKLALRSAYTTWSGTEAAVPEVASSLAVTVYDASTFNATADVFEYRASIMLSGMDYTTISSGDLLDAVQDLYFGANGSSVTLSGYTWAIDADPYSYGSSIVVQWQIEFDSPTFPLAVSNNLPASALEAIVFRFDATNFEYAPGWDSGVTFAAGSLVLYNQGIYESISGGNVGNIPTDILYWTTFISNVQKYVTVAGNASMNQWFFMNAYNNDPDVTLRLNASIVWNAADHAPALFFGQADEWKPV